MKADLRNKAKRVLQSLDGPSLARKSSLVASRLSKILNDLQSNSDGIILGVYSPLKGEVLWYEELRLSGKVRFAVAHVVDESKMEFHSVELETVRAKKLGLQLAEDHIGSPVIPDAILVPGLAFTSDCHRLGRGKGYFDRFLANYRGLKIGVCFKEQIFPQVPMDEFDVVMDLVITDDNIYTKKDREHDN